MTKTKKALIAVLTVMCLVCVGLFTLTACGEKVTLSSLEVTTPPAKVEYLEGDKFDPTGLVVSAVYSDETKEAVTEYTLSIEKDAVLKATDKKVTVTYIDGETTVEASFNITVTKKTVELSDVALSTNITLEVRDNKVYYVIKDCTFDYKVSGYTDEELAEILPTVVNAQAIQDAIYFDLQENPYVASGKWDGSWNLFCNEGAHVATLDMENKKFELSVDITNLGANCYTTHCDTTFHSTSNHDFKPDAESFTKEVTLGETRYEMILVNGGGDDAYWGCVGIKIEPTVVKTLTADSINFEVSENKVYYVVNLVAENLTEDEAKAMVTKIDFQAGTLKDPEDETKSFYLIYENKDIAFTWDGTNNVLTAKVEITSLQKDYYWTHLFLNGESQDLAINMNKVTPVTNGNLKYGNAFTEFSWGTRFLLTVIDKDAEFPVAKTNVEKVNNGKGALAATGKWSYYLQSKTGSSCTEHYLTEDNTLVITLKDTTNTESGNVNDRIYYMSSEATGTQIKMTFTAKLSVDGTLEFGCAGSGKQELTANEGQEVELTFTVGETDTTGPLRICAIVAEADKAEVTVTLSNITIEVIEADAE